MTPRETILQAFSFEEINPVPYHIPMEDDVAQRITAYYGSDEWKQKIVPYLSLFMFGFGGPEIANGRRKDIFGVVYEEGNILHVLEHPLVDGILDSYQWPDPSTVFDWNGLHHLISPATQSYRCAGLAFGLFERAWLLRGMEELLVDMLINPAFVDELLDRILDFHLHTLDCAAEHLNIDAYFSGDDWCDQRGAIMGADLWRRFFKPRLARLIARCHDHGLPFICHSCGNVLPLVDDLLEIGLDGLESLQPEAMDIFELKRKTKGRMILIGGMGVQSTMRFGTPDDVHHQLERLQQEMGNGGGYVLAPAKALLPDTPTENAVALLEAVV